MNILKNFYITILIIIMVFITVVISLALWNVQRKIHYKLGYSSMVQEQMEPLVKRIDALEKKVVELDLERKR